MRSLGVAAGVVLWAPSDAYFSYYNSPYIGHENGAAVDIYPAHASWDGPGFSPVDGGLRGGGVNHFRQGPLWGTGF